LWIAPFFVFADGERQEASAWCEHVHKRHVADDGMKKIWTQIADGAHSIVRRRCRLDDESFAAGETFSDQVFG